jgi:hypothetical protein
MRSKRTEIGRVQEIDWKTIRGVGTSSKKL